jgi:UDP-3-O-[3-hydroxymyristoyl] glucosamine N-acyltransferase
MHLGELAAQLGCDLQGDADIDIVRVATLEDAGPGDVTFLANSKYAAALSATRASAVIAAPDVEGAPCPVIRSTNPYLTFARAVGLLHPQTRSTPGVHATAIVADDAVIEDGVWPLCRRCGARAYWGALSTQRARRDRRGRGARS